MPEVNFLKNKNILITGIAGFAGSWLAEKIYELQPNCQIFGLVKESSSLENISHIVDRIKILHGDILDIRSVQNAMKTSNPNLIFHLAAQASTKRGFEDPLSTYNINVIGTLNILEATRISDIDSIIHFTSTGNIYGKVPKEEQPIKEATPTRSIDPYAMSKALAEAICSSYFELYGMRIIRTRAFHHEGPRCQRDMICLKICKQIINAKNSGKKELIFGNVDIIRDFSDVRDIVKGYLLAVENGRAGDVYNLCSGNGIKIRDIIEKIATYAMLKDFQIISKPELVRQFDVPVLIGDNIKAKKELGWQPKISFEQTLKDMIEYYSNKTK
jgi:GDP-mannose 4,6-dehydratase